MFFSEHVRPTFHDCGFRYEHPTLFEARFGLLCQYRYSTGVCSVAISGRDQYLTVLSPRLAIIPYVYTDLIQHVYIDLTLYVYIHLTLYVYLDVTLNVYIDITLYCNRPNTICIHRFNIISVRRLNTICVHRLKTIRTST